MKAVVTLLFAVCVTVIVAIVLALAVGRLTPAVAVISLIGGVIGGGYAWFAVAPSNRQSPKPTPTEWFAVGCFTVFALRAFCWVVFIDEDSLSILSESNYSDLPLHLTFINYFARGAAFWPDSPIYSGAKLHYPFGTDLLNALLALVGVGDIRGLVLVGLIASLVTCIALYHWGRGFAIAGFLFNGGLAASSFFSDTWESAHQFLSTGHFALALTDYQAEMAWKNIALAMFVPQRGLLYALPAGLVLLISWRGRWLSRSAAPPLLPLSIEAVLYAAMPLFSVHAFMWFSAVLACWIIVGTRRIRVYVAKLLAVSFVPASIFVTLVTGLFDRNSPIRHSVHFKPGWLQDDDGWFEFWIGNFGILPVCVVALLILTFWRVEWRIPSRSLARTAGAGHRSTVSRLSRFGLRLVRRDWRDDKTRGAIAFVIPSVLMFLISCFVMFAAWEWDNTKIMIWSYLCLLPFIWQALVRPLPRFGAVVLCGVLFFSGFLSLWGGIDWSHTGWPIADKRDLDEVRNATAGLPVDDTFAGYPGYNHLLLLSGCKMVEGFEGHLHSHGMEYTDRLQQLHALMVGQSNWRDIARNLHVHYLFWGELEEQHYPESLMPWRNQSKLIAHGEWGDIYDLRSVPH